MDNHDSLLKLAQKVSHRLPEIRDRSMKVLCTKFLSPLATDEHFRAISGLPGFIGSVLQWVNERYDACDYTLLADTLRALERMVSRNEGLRMAFLEVGGVAFFDEFAIHNPTLKNESDRLVSVAFHGRPVPNAFPPADPIPPSETLAHPPVPVSSVPPNVSSEDEQTLFELSVQIKFATSVTLKSTIDQAACEIIFAVSPNVPASMFIEFSPLVESICGQLRKSISINPITDECCDPLFDVMDHVVTRIEAEQVAIPHVWISSLISCLCESFERRPQCIYRTAPLVLRLVSLCRHTIDSKWPIGHLESIVSSATRSADYHFGPEKYFIERFDFAKSFSPVLLRKLHKVMTCSELLVAEVLIEVLSLARDHDCRPDFISQHVNDWICDERFYLSSRRAKAIAAKGALVAQDDDDSFSKARQVIVSLKKLLSRGEVLTDYDVHNIGSVCQRVPELFGDDIQKIATRFMTQLCDQNEWTSIQDLVARDQVLADVLIDLKPCSIPPPGWVTECIANNCSSRPRQFINSIYQMLDEEVPEIFSSKLMNDLSVTSIVRRLFSTNVRDRRQAIVTLSARQPHEVCFLEIDQFDDSSVYQRYALKTNVQVDDKEVLNTIQLALNPRLSTDIRIASATQACTLLTVPRALSINSPDIVSQLIANMNEVHLFAKLSDLFCLLADMKCLVGLDGTTTESVITRLVDQVLFCSDKILIDDVLRVFSRLVFGRHSFLPLTSNDDKVYWGLVWQLERMEEYHVLDMASYHRGGETQEDRAGLSDKVLAICLSLESSSSQDESVVCSSDPRTIEEAVVAGVSINSETMKKFVLSIEAMMSREKFVANILVPASRIATITESGEIFEAIIRVSDTLNLDELSEYEFVYIVKARMKSMIYSSANAASIPEWMTKYLSSSSQAVVNCLLEYMVLFSTLVGGSPLNDSSNTLSSIEECVFRYPSRFTMSSWMWILWRCEKVPFATLEKISQLLDNDGDIGEMAWTVLNKFKSQFSFDDLSVWQRSVLRMRLIHSAAKYVADGVEKNPNRAEEILDMMEIDPNEWDLEILAALSSIDSEKANRISQLIDWSQFRSGNPQLMLDIVVNCCRENLQLLVYIVHIGLLAEILDRLSSSSPSLERLLSLILGTIPQSPMNHFEVVMKWISTKKFISLFLQYRENMYEIVRLASILVCDHYCGNFEWFPLEIFESVVCEEILLNANACAALTELCRIPSNKPSSSLSISVSKMMGDLMTFHDTVPIPDMVDIFCESGSSILFHSQMRLIASIVAADVDDNEDHQLLDKYSRWFSSVWQRALVIPTTRKTSPFPVLTELVCGLIEVIKAAIVCRGEKNKFKSLYSPISFVLSFVTTSGDCELSFFSLCLSVGQVAAPLLIDKPIVGKILHTLIGLHATVHSRNVPKTLDSVQRFQSVVAFCASMIGCRVCNAQVMDILDGWFEVGGNDLIDSSLLVRLVGSIVLSRDGHFRTELASMQKGKSILSNLSSEDPKSIETLIISVLQETSLKMNREISACISGA